MAYESDILLGKIIKLSGYDGTVALKLEPAFSEDLPEMESVFLEIEGRLVPFIISELEYQGAGTAKLKFDGYESQQSIREFIGSRVFLTSGTATEDAQDSFGDLEGFRVYNQDNELLGSVKEVIYNPGQLLLAIASPDNRELLVPLHEDLIISFDRVKCSIVMNLPEGITDIN